MYNQIYKEYQDSKILTASQEKLLILLYEALLKEMRQAKDLLLKKNVSHYEQIHKHLMKAQDIITELMLSLDKEKGGEFANRMESLYQYFLQQLTRANLEKEVKYVQEVLEHTEKLYEAWLEAVQKLNQTKSTSQSTLSKKS